MYSLSLSLLTMVQVKMIRDDSSVLVPYGLETDGLDLGLEEDVALLAELLMIHQTMDQVRHVHLTFNFTFSRQNNIIKFTLGGRVLWVRVPPEAAHFSLIKELSRVSLCCVVLCCLVCCILHHVCACMYVCTCMYACMYMILYTAEGAEGLCD